MAVILAIETSAHVCSVTLWSNGKELALKESAEANAHSKTLTIMILDLLKEAAFTGKNIDAVAVSKGPGSYTGLRIGVSVAKGLCYGWSKPLIAVDTIKAQGAFFIRKNPEHADNLLCPLFDARRMEVYTALYKSDLSEILPVQAMIIDENSFEFFLKENKIAFFGTGAEKCKEIIKHPNAFFVNDISPSSSGVAVLAEDMFIKKEFADVAYFEPYYLKEFIAGKPSRKVI